MSVLASTIAREFERDISSIEGKAGREFHAARPLSQPEQGALTFIRPDVAGVESLAPRLAGMGIVCTAEHAIVLAKADVTCLITENPRLTFLRIVGRYFGLPRPKPGIHPAAVVAASAVIAPDASVGANCFVGEDCRLGARSILHPGVIVGANVRIGADVVIYGGTVIGADGFGYERNESGALEKFPHIGGVVIEDDVEIGSNTSIDRGSLGDTVIGTGTRVDNQCHISHNVQIGRHVAVIAQCMIGGSCRVGDYAWLAPGAMVMNQIRIGQRATVGLGAVVVKDVADGQTVMGSPAVPSDQFRADRAALRQLLSR
jgi:UDP-3-O-[3-hydroxymyristoyl] glucosamine N-acyltransferase